MDESHQLFWKLHFEKFSTDDLLQSDRNPIWDYRDELIDGPVIDVGCGQSEILLRFATTPRKVYALDNEPLQLDWLEKRVHALPGANFENWHFLDTSFPQTPLPDHRYALIVLSNFLHFYTLADCQGIANGLLRYTAKGSMVYVKAHSHSHYANQPGNPERYDYFKHYFTAQDLSALFPPAAFERIYAAETDRACTKGERDFSNLWIEKWYQQSGIYDEAEIARAQQQQLAGYSHSDVSAIFRRR